MPVRYQWATITCNKRVSTVAQLSLIFTTSLGERWSKDVVDMSSAAASSPVAAADVVLSRLALRFFRRPAVATTPTFLIREHSYMTSHYWFSLTHYNGCLTLTFEQKVIFPPPSYLGDVIYSLVSRCSTARGSSYGLVPVSPAKIKARKSILFTEGTPEVEVNVNTILLNYVSQSFYLGTRGDVERFPDQRTDHYLMNNGEQT